MSRALIVTGEPLPAFGWRVVRAVKKAAPRALNRAMNSTRTHTIRNTAKRLGVSGKLIRPKVRRNAMDRANRRRQKATLYVIWDRFPVHHLREFTLASWNRSPGGGVHIDDQFYKGAFLINLKKMRGKKKGFGVYERKTRKRFPVRAISVPIPELREEAERAVRRIGMPMLEKRFQHELNRELRPR